jgi:cytochrome c-type biogenesis protein CcmH/NrfF
VDWNNALLSVAPTVLVGLIFWFIMRAILRADRTERKVQSKVEAEERARLGLAPAESGREG